MSSISPEKLAAIYQKAVKNELGLISEVDTDNDVVFKHPDMGGFFFSLDADNDPEFMRLVYPNFMDERLTKGDKDKLIDIVNQVNIKNKAVKLYVRQASDGTMNVSAAVECFVAAPDQAPTQEHLNAIIKRTLSALRAGVESLVKLGQQGQDSI